MVVPLRSGGGGGGSISSSSRIHYVQPMQLTRLPKTKRQKVRIQFVQNYVALRLVTLLGLNICGSVHHA